MELQDLPKEKLIEIIISTNKKRERLGRKWQKVATYWKGAFVNACHNQMEVVQENRELKAHIREMKQKKQLYPIDSERIETVKHLWREVPGAGLGGCSKALREADGDYDKAREIAERIANEPKVL